VAQSRMQIAGIRALKAPSAVVLGHLGVDTICVSLCMLRLGAGERGIWVRCQVTMHK